MQTRIQERLFRLLTCKSIPYHLCIYHMTGLFQVPPMCIVCTLGCHCFTETLKNFAQDCTALSRFYILSRLHHYCPATAPSFWCGSIRFDCTANDTDIQRFCKPGHRVSGGGVAVLQQIQQGLLYSGLLICVVQHRANEVFSFSCH
jgi:hypothetical protein